ncbi:MAG: glycine betaine ABC transporter substrate-binding protein [Spirochaetota bacterium]
MNRRMVLLLMLAGVLGLLASCNQDDEETSSEAQRRDTERGEVSIEVVYPDWSSEIASAHLVKAVLQERLGYQVELTSVGVADMWARVASGRADVLLGAWLPVTHEEYYEQYSDSLVDLGPNLTGARIGLVVPTFQPGVLTDEGGRTGQPLVTVESIPELSEYAGRFDGRIVGIESGAGVVQRTREAISHYELQGDFRLYESDEAHMLDALSRAVNRNEWIVLTGWSPHWMFERYAVDFLDDPDNVFGGEESIHTMTREGFKEDAPDAHEVLDRIEYTRRDFERLLWWIQNDDSGDVYAQALRWIRVYSDTVDEWVAGVE